VNEECYIFRVIKFYWNEKPFIYISLNKNSFKFHSFRCQYSTCVLRFLMEETPFKHGGKAKKKVIFFLCLIN
jgi:hypothetical protein